MSEENQEAIDHELVSAEKWARSNAANLPPQFNGDPDKFLASFKEMRSTLTKTQQENAELKKSSSPPPADKAIEPTKPIDNLTIPNKAPEPEEHNWDVVNQELLSTGDLSAETRAMIQKKLNVPEYMVSGYVDGIKARQQQHAASAAQVVGGTQELTDIIKWSQENLGEDERQAVNMGLRSPGWQNVLLGLKARAAVVSKEPKSKVDTVAGHAPTLKPFATSAEMVMAMRDPKYKYDSAYQDMVQQRVRLSGTLKNV